MGLEWWGGNGDAWLLWDPSLDSGSNLQERLVVWTELLKLVKLQQLSRKYIRVPVGRVLTNKQTMWSLVLVNKLVTST
jgi:hypothetical protein